MIAKIIRHLSWRRRVEAAHGRRDELRARYAAARRRIADQAPAVPDPAGRRARRPA